VADDVRLLPILLRPPPGRFLVFGLWLGLRWHLFVRGWDFFLRG
jgi:hypothetical protein